MQFQVDGSNFGSAVTLVNGTASLAFRTLTADRHSINAVYTSDTSNFGNS